MKEIFNFDEQRIKKEVNRKYKLGSNLKKSFKYLEGKLPVNKITKIFRNLKFREGKSYDWYLFTDKEVSIIVRKYGGHSTVYALNSPKPSEDNYFERDVLTVFTMFNNRSKMTDEECEDDYDNFTLLGSLVELIKIVRKNEGHTVWNSLCFKVPEYTDVKLVFQRETVYQLDTMLFACDEMSQTHLELFAENEMLEKIKTLQPGDPFGSYSKIKSTSTVVKDDYYHGVGVYTERTDEWGMQHEKEPKWSDVYGLTRSYYDEVFPEDSTNKPKTNIEDEEN